MHEVFELMNVLWGCFTFSSHPREKGWWHFTARRCFTMTKEAPSSVHSWNEKFFFVDVDPAWGIPINWAAPKKTPAGLSDLLGEEKRGIDALRQLVSEHRLPLVASLLVEDTLVNMGLSFVPLKGEFRHVFGSTFPFCLS